MSLKLVPLPEETESVETVSLVKESCAHCGLPVPPALMTDAVNNFCCSGCETVYELLQGAGLANYYSFRAELGEEGRPAPDVPGSTGGELDSPAFQKLYCRELPSGGVETELLLSGVHCAACVWLVERLPKLEPGVRSARLDMGRSLLELEWDPEVVKLGEVARTLTKMGYAPRPFRGREAEEMRRAEMRALLIRMGVAGASAGNVMLMAFALYSGAVGIDESHTMAPTTRRFFEIASLVVSLPALWAAGLFFRGAWAALRTRTPHMDLPIAIGIGVGFLWGTFAALSGTGELYFDSITALVFFLLIGRSLQRRHQMAASDAAELLDAVVPGSARILDVQVESGGDPFARSHEELSTGDVVPGAEVLVFSGEVSPVDGVVVYGESSLDKSLLSGESRPIDVTPGDGVEAGALNLGGALIVRARRSGTETRVAQLMHEVGRALSTRTPMVSRADRIAGGFTISVLALALAVGIYWSRSSGFAGIQHALALLIVACPCALGLATPLALSSSVHQAAKTGKLVFSPEALERLAEPMTLLLDKTGTLTEGRLSVRGFEGNARLVSLALAAEEGATHPVARALQRYAKEHQYEFESRESPNQISEKLGRGLSGVYRGQEFLVGSPAYVTGRAKWKLSLKQALDSAREGDTPILVAHAGEIGALIWLEDKIREDAAESLKSLRRRGHRLELLSGDHSSAVEGVAARLSAQAGVQLFDAVSAEVTPEEKLGYVCEHQRSGCRVAMVGDGVNDAGALARADVGVAVQGAAEACRLSADVYLSKSGVSELDALVKGAEKTLRTVRRGIGFSLAYNALGISAAAFGLLGPLGAAVLMPLSSLTVVTNAYRSRMFRQDSSLHGSVRPSTFKK